MIIPEFALSVRQPWAWLIVHGWKDIENRDWHSRYRGPVAIHAGLKIETDVAAELIDGFSPMGGMMPAEFAAPPIYEVGGIIGIAEIVDCVSKSPSRWFAGAYGFVLQNAEPVPLIPCKGQLGFFRHNTGALA